MSDAQPASDTQPAFERISVDDAGAPLRGTFTSAVMSDDAAIVAFEATPPDGDTTTVVDPAAGPSQVWVRDRIGGTTRPVFEPQSGAPGLSGDGCTMAYSVRSASLTVSLTVVDLCPDPDVVVGGSAPDGGSDPLPAGTPVDVSTGVGTPADPAVPFAVPALSEDGSVLVWSTGRDVRRYELVAGVYVRDTAFDAAAVPDIGEVTGADVDVSADGSALAMVAGPGPLAYEPSPSNVYVWSIGDPQPVLVSPTSTGAKGLADSDSPSLSPDGSSVIFESSNPDLADSSTAVPFIVRVDRPDPAASTMTVLAEDAHGPRATRSGDQVVYTTNQAIRVISLDKDPDRPRLATANPSGRVSISQSGQLIAFASSSLDDEGAPATAAKPGESAVWLVDLRALDALPPTTTTTTTTTTIPTATTTTDPTSPTTSTTPVTGPSGTAPVTTGPTTPVVPPRFPSTSYPFPGVTAPYRPTTPYRPTRPYQPSNPYQPTNPYDPYTGGTGGVPFVSATPFAATVVDAGRRVGTVTLTNSTTDPVTVVAATVTPPGPFSVTTDNCTGRPTEAGESCAIDVTFAPTEVGQTTASLTLMLSDGSLVTASLEGDGTEQPTIELLPAVAGAGQTVTVFGAGFEPGSSIELVRPGARESEFVAIDGDGTFAYVLVVLPNTPAGPLVLEVPGQPDLFADTTAELIVSGRGTSSGDPALRGAVGSPIRGRTAGALGTTRL